MAFFQLSGHCAVLPSPATTEPDPPMTVAQPRGSVHWKSKPNWLMFLASKADFVASLPLLSTVRIFASCATVSQFQSTWVPFGIVYFSPTVCGGSFRPASLNNALL